MSLENGNMAKVMTMCNGRTVCNVVGWPPKQSEDGWVLEVQGNIDVMDFLCICLGCSFKVNNFLLEYLVKVKIQYNIILDEDEFQQQAKLTFADVTYLCSQITMDGDCTKFERNAI